MKKIAMLGDLHGNLTATLAMEKALKDYHVDEIWFLGGQTAPASSVATGIMASAASASPRITISGISWAKSA